MLYHVCYSRVIRVSSFPSSARHKCVHTLFNCLFDVHNSYNSIFSHFVPQDGRTALMRASIKGHTDVVQLLLSIGAQVDLKDKVRHSINL